MTKIINIIAVTLIFLLLHCATVSGGEYNPGVTRYVKTSSGKYLVFKNGRLQAYIDKMPSSNTFIKRESYGSLQRKQQAARKLKSIKNIEWSAKRSAEIKKSGMYWWELTNSSSFKKTK